MWSQRNPGSSSSSSRESAAPFAFIKSVHNTNPSRRDRLGQSNLLMDAHRDAPDLRSFSEPPTSCRTSARLVFDSVSIFHSR